MFRSGRVIAFAAAAIFTLSGGGSADDKPVSIRLGTTTTSGEDQIWLMKARPDITPNQGKAYTLETFPFRGGDLRFRAFQAGQVDGAVSTGTGALTAATKGVALSVVAALSEEDDAFYSSPYVVLDNSPIKSPKDLKGKTIGLNGLREAFELGARLALLDAGLDPDRDVKWAVIPPASMGEALRSGKIDLAAISQPFYEDERTRGGIRTLFTHAGASGFKDEFVLFFDPKFIRQNNGAMKAFIADFRVATDFYLKNMREARQAILQAKLIDMDPAVYLPMVALRRKADGKPSKEYFIALQKALLRTGYVNASIDIDTILDMSVFEN